MAVLLRADALSLNLVIIVRNRQEARSAEAAKEYSIDVDSIGAGQLGVFQAAQGQDREAYCSTLLGSVGTEFKVMQELMRHSSLRSTMDVYTQAITLSEVLSLLFPPGMRDEVDAKERGRNGMQKNYTALKGRGFV
jgi:hypothetical protein